MTHTSSMYTQFNGMPSLRTTGSSVAVELGGGPQGSRFDRQKLSP